MIAAARQAGFPLVDDYNGESQEGFGYYQTNTHRGRRWSMADAYLRPAMARPGLVVRINCRVQSVDFVGKRAVGVTYLQSGRRVSVRADAEVILAAGAVHTPNLLELSGIGDPGILQKAGIACRHPLPGVGANYLDHYCTRMNWRVKLPVTLNEMSRGPRLLGEIARYYLRRRGILTLGTGLVHGFVKTSPDLEGPDVQFFFMHASYGSASDRVLERSPGMTMGVTQLRPESRGTIHVRSPDPSAPPEIRPNFLSAEIDRSTLIAGMQVAREVIAQPALDRYRDFEMTPGADVQTYDQWLDFARSNGQTIYHVAGTCRMGRDDRAVVDENLKVRGIDALRVVDASVMPRMVSANTQAAVMMIAEKGSDLIRHHRP